MFEFYTPVPFPPFLAFLKILPWKYTQPSTRLLVEVGLQSYID